MNNFPLRFDGAAKCFPVRNLQTIDNQNRCTCRHFHSAALHTERGSDRERREKAGTGEIAAELPRSCINGHVRSSSKQRKRSKRKINFNPSPAGNQSAQNRGLKTREILTRLSIPSNPPTRELADSIETSFPDKAPFQPDAPGPQKVSQEKFNNCSLNLEPQNNYKRIVPMPASHTRRIPPMCEQTETTRRVETVQSRPVQSRCGRNTIG